MKVVLWPDKGRREVQGGAHACRGELPEAEAGVRRIEQRSHELQSVAEALPTVEVEVVGQGAGIVDVQSDAVVVGLNADPDRLPAGASGGSVLDGIGEELVDHDRQRHDFVGGG